VRLAVLVLACVASLSPSPAKQAAAAKETKPLLETWQAAYLEGAKIGHVHTLAREVEKDGQKVVHTVQKIHFAVKRYGGVLNASFTETSDETPAGKVLGRGLAYKLGADQAADLAAVVKGGKAVITNAGEKVREAAWDDAVTGLYAQKVFWKKKNIKPGDRFSLKDYQIALGGVITLRVVAKGFETTDQLVAPADADKGKVERRAVKLLRVEVHSDKILVGETPVQLPVKVFWLDDKLQPVREQTEIPGMGLITLYTTTKAGALKEGVAPELLPDFGLRITIKLDQTIENPYDTTEAVYRVTLQDDLAGVFTTDGRQAVRNKKGKTFEVAVRAVRTPAKTDKARPGAEYTESNNFIDSDNPLVRATAARVAGKETDPWRKAQLLEKWVFDNMKFSASVGFPSAGKVCRDLRGDCRQHAVLLTALCRAAGLPSRTAMGLIYVREEGRSPVFAFHMWTEVWVGRWLALDAVQGRGGVGAAYLKMADHSWGKTLTLAPLLPVVQVLGKLKIDVVSAK
jgi:transglutaminase-like putative cysteine protease